MEASAPAITAGSIKIMQAGGTPNPTGAFFSSGTNYPAAGANVAWVPEIHGFDASRCSSIYGASNTIHPVSKEVRFIMKY